MQAACASRLRTPPAAPSLGALTRSTPDARTSPSQFGVACRSEIPPCPCAFIVFQLVFVFTRDAGISAGFVNRTRRGVTRNDGRRRGVGQLGGNRFGQWRLRPDADGLEEGVCPLLEALGGRAVVGLQEKGPGSALCHRDQRREAVPRLEVRALVAS